MEILIRKAVVKDVKKILDIINHEILNSTALYDYKEKTYAQQMNWFEQKNINGMPIIVVESNDEVIGFGTYGIFRPFDAFQFCVEHSIYIDHNVRGLGVGKQLLTKLIQLAKEDGHHTMIAGLDATNEASLEFHKKFGFQEAGVIKEAGFKFNKWLDLRFLQLILK